jgi:hypothetical protein
VVLAPEGRTYTMIAANSSGFAAFFCRRPLFVRQKRSFFACGPRERLRSCDETASYVLNSVLDSPGAAKGALKGQGRV